MIIPIGKNGFSFAFLINLFESSSYGFCVDDCCDAGDEDDSLV